MSYTEIFLKQYYEFVDKTGQIPETIYMSYEMFEKLVCEYELNICTLTNKIEILGYKVDFAEFREGITKVVFSIV